MKRKYNYQAYIGKQIGNLLIKDVVHRNNNHLFFNCQCSCGSPETQIEARNVVEKRRTSCGKCHLYNILGKHFGRLTVVKIDGYKCICACDCGNTNVVCLYTDLHNGRKQSCGCILQDKKNIFQKYDTYATGTTNKGEVFYFDLEVYDIVTSYTWRVNHNGYLVANVYDNGKRKVIEMHRFLFESKDGLCLDHINRNKLDNRASNLRCVTQSHNGFNINTQPNNTSGKTGVAFNKKNNNYVSYIRKNHKSIYLGSYTTLKDAIQAREKAEINLFGEYQDICKRDFLTYQSHTIQKRFDKTEESLN